MTTTIVIMSTKVEELLETPKTEIKDKVLLVEVAKDDLVPKATWTNILGISKNAKKLMKKLVIYLVVLLVKKEYDLMVSNCQLYVYK